jgi:hypothetical protein
MVMCVDVAGDQPTDRRLYFPSEGRGMSNFVHGLLPTLREEKGHIQFRSRPAGIVSDFAHGQSPTLREEKRSYACLQ